MSNTCSIHRRRLAGWIGFLLLTTSGLLLAQSTNPVEIPKPPIAPTLPDLLTPPPTPAEAPLAPLRPQSSPPVLRSARPQPPTPRRPAQRFPAAQTTQNRRPTGALAKPFPLVFDTELKEVTAEKGATNLVMEFSLTNTSPDTVSVEYVRGSCGCTVPKLPSLPWVLEPSEHGSFEINVDLRGKRGVLSKMVYMFTSHGYKTLRLKVNIPLDTGSITGRRLEAMRVAAADRQAVFRNDCATCHAEPGKGKTGRQLYEAVCGVCHEAEHRASMVPDLSESARTMRPELWRFWITYGRSNTLMPAFSENQEGILSEEQIESLVEHLSERWSKPAPSASGGLHAQ